MEFTRREKLAIVHAVDVILFSDGEAHDKEVELLAMVALQFNFLPADIFEARKLNASEVAIPLKSMNPEKKEFFRGLCATMANADGNIDNSELRAISLFFALLG